jgi:hypothetical protein
VGAPNNSTKNKRPLWGDLFGLFKFSTSTPIKTGAEADLLQLEITEVSCNILAVEAVYIGKQGIL